MVSVAVVATLLGGSLEACRLWSQSAVCRQRASAHARRVAALRRSISDREAVLTDDSGKDRAEEVLKIASLRQMLAQELVMDAEYDRAARRPWLSMPSDPFPPLDPPQPK
jgi:hypothetical protein